MTRTEDFFLGAALPVPPTNSIDPSILKERR
jgi:hypothetical protein